MNFKEFKPALYFVGKFLVVYLVMNTLYGLYITKFEGQADTITSIVTDHAAAALRVFGFEAETGTHDQPSIPIYLDGERTVSVFEGCNSLNVIIVMLAFLVAYQGKGKHYLWFVPLSIVLIYIFNLIRIDALVLVNVHLPDYMYFTHKYLFTAFIYAVVFLLWFWWVKLSR
jgi:exosortase family protein XrtF